MNLRVSADFDYAVVVDVDDGNQLAQPVGEG